MVDLELGLRFDDVAIGGQPTRANLICASIAVR
jgi:hypothetical protein